MKNKLKCNRLAHLWPSKMKKLSRPRQQSRKIFSKRAMMSHQSLCRGSARSSRTWRIWWQPSLSSQSERARFSMLIRSQCPLPSIQLSKSTWVLTRHLKMKNRLSSLPSNKRARELTHYRKLTRRSFSRLSWRLKAIPSSRQTKNRRSLNSSMWWLHLSSRSCKAPNHLSRAT